MIRGEAAPDFALRSATLLAVALVLGAWTAAPALASHPESALQDILADDTITTPVLADATTTTDSVVEELEDADAAEEKVKTVTETPAITTRLPGVSDSSLPSFRRQMYRTDI